MVLVARLIRALAVHVMRVPVDLGTPGLVVPRTKVPVVLGIQGREGRRTMAQGVLLIQVPAVHVMQVRADRATRAQVERVVRVPRYADDRKRFYMPPNSDLHGDAPPAARA